MLAHEQLGRATNALWDVPWRPSNVLRYAPAEQVEEYVRPEIAGRAAARVRDHRGGRRLDPSVLADQGRPRRRRLAHHGEKWFVTTGDIADYFIVVADAEGHGLTSFLVDKQPGRAREAPARASCTRSSSSTRSSPSTTSAWTTRRSSAASAAASS